VPRIYKGSFSGGDGASIRALAIKGGLLRSCMYVMVENSLQIQLSYVPISVSRTSLWRLVASIIAHLELELAIGVHYSPDFAS
jgi:hypothetical protein